MDISRKGVLPGPKEEQPILFVQKSDVRRQTQLPIRRRTQKKKNKKASQKQAESIGAGRAGKELPRPLKELPRQPVPPKPRVKDAQLAALEARRDKTRDLKQAMMQELLTGKTRLVPAGGAHA